jgi:hypothetical protein
MAATFHSLDASPSWTGFQSRPAPLGIAAPLDQSAALKHLEVLRDGRKARLKRRGKFRDRHLADREAGENRPPGGIGERGKRGAEPSDAEVT